MFPKRSMKLYICNSNNEEIEFLEDQILKVKKLGENANNVTILSKEAFM